MPENRPRGLTELADPGARPLTTSELAHLVGMSATFIRTEIKSGQLRAIAIGRGRKRVFRILSGDAVRYMRELGVLS